MLWTELVTELSLEKMEVLRNLVAAPGHTARIKSWFKDWGDSSVGHRLPVQAGRAEFRVQNPCENLGLVVCALIPVLGKWRQGASRGSLASQSRLSGKFLASERSCLKKQGREFLKIMIWGVSVCSLTFSFSHLTACYRHCSYSVPISLSVTHVWKGARDHPGSSSWHAMSLAQMEFPGQERAWDTVFAKNSSKRNVADLSISEANINLKNPSKNKIAGFQNNLSPLASYCVSGEWKPHVSGSRVRWTRRQSLAPHSTTEQHVQEMNGYKRIQMKQMTDQELTAIFIKHRGHAKTVIKV